MPAAETAYDEVFQRGKSGMPEARDLLELLGLPPG